MKMELIKSLIFILEVLGLVFLIGLVVDIILDTIIINPILNRKMLIQKARLFDLIIEKMKNGEDIPDFPLESVEQEEKK
jgi:hypothetical protein